MRAGQPTPTPTKIGQKGTDVPTSTSRDSRFDDAIEAARERLDTLRWRAAEDAEGVERHLSAAFEELQVTLEELQVADEELRQQNEELALARMRRPKPPR
jgi:flavin-binding protein dodecin